MSAAGAG